MPYLNIETNQKIKDETILSEVSAFMARLLNKPENYIMISITDQKTMMFAGKADPTALIQLKSIGLSTEQCKEIAPKMNTFFESLLSVSGDRIYIDMIDIDRQMFAWNGKTFG
ncbi:Macrophage migration inhibitory factor [Candidatus Magnetomorum sp. HK-1]|nr:Macrophage migration inhibitory factor [Candidatus Magnetomorum sp. HK-1]